MLNVLDLFSGVGGFSLGLEMTGGFKTVAFCEKAEFQRAVLKKNFPNIPIFDDVFNLKRTDINETVDLVCGGFPCQPFSVAGKRRGAADDRFLWPQMLRIIKEFKPRWVIGENVAGFISMELDRALADLEKAGYEGQAFILPACAVDAPHRRDRCFILAHSCFKGQKMRAGKKVMTCAGYAKLFPTPVAADAQGSHGGGRGSSLRTDISEWKRQTGASGQLNPSWVEWLMGFPIGWTELPPSETPSSRRSSRKSDTQS